MAVALREAVDERTARFRAYRRRIERLMAEYETFETTQVRAAMAAIRRARLNIQARLAVLPIAASGQAGWWEAGQLQALDAVMAAETRDLAARLKTTLDGAVLGGWQQGEAFQSDALARAGIDLLITPQVSTEQLRVLLAQNADLVVDVSTTFRRKVGEITRLAALGAASPMQAARDIGALLRTEPRRTHPRLGSIPYQAERIVRTETGRAFAIADDIRQTDIAKAAPGLSHWWQTAADERVRAAHVVAGRRYTPGGDPGPIPKDQAFEIGGESLRFPKDPRGSAANVIACRCVANLWRREWFGEEAAARTVDLDPDDLGEVADQAGRDILAATKNQYERGVALSPRGQTIWAKTGERDQIDIGEATVLGWRGKDVTMIHNHPLGSSFSLADIEVAIAANLRAIRAVAPTVTYVMERMGAAWPNAAKVREAYLFANEALYMKYRPEVLAGRLAPEQASLRHSHELWERIVREVAMRYERRQHGTTA